MEKELIFTIVLQSAVVSAVVSSVISPWINWGIKKREMRYKKRIEVISKFKKHIQAAIDGLTMGRFTLDDEFELLRESSDYFDMKSYLSPEIRAKIDSKQSSDTALETCKSIMGHISEIEINYKIK